MKRIAYSVPRENKIAEKEWLNNQKIYPSMYDWNDINGKFMTAIGLIAGTDIELLIKLRHKKTSMAIYNK